MHWDVQWLLGVAVIVAGAALLLSRSPELVDGAAQVGLVQADGAQAEIRVDAGVAAASGTRKPQLRWRDYVQALFPVLLVVFLFRAFILEPYRIPTGSMIPTLAIGDYVLVNKLAYCLRLPLLDRKLITLGTPRHGDVMVFVPPHERRYFIKRVVGLPGDRVRYVGGDLYVNGRRVDVALDADDDASDGVQRFVEDLDGARHGIQRFIGMRSREGEWLVPEGRYFMLGDNRDMSEDSRYWGYVTADQIVGRAVAIWIHKPPGLSWPSFTRNGVVH